MKKVCGILLALVFLVSCTATFVPSQSVPTATSTATVIPVTATTTPTGTPTLTATPLPTPTLTPTPTATPTEREIALQEHEAERIQYLAEQGPTTEIPVFEYHGDNYSMEFDNGAVVELGPDAFEAQMKWFKDNHVHSVTGTELILWLAGKIQLPARSVVLTFDQGYSSAPAIKRMIPVFEKYQMFGITSIFVKFMNEGESVNCIDDACWQAFRDAYLSGHFDIGSHTMTHRDFALLPENEGLAELTTSKQTIERHIGNGCVVNILAWPYESIPAWGKDISSVGFEIGFGGTTYPILQNAAWQDKPEDWFQLPRILPPNSDGVSGRPGGKTLPEIMEMYSAPGVWP